MKRTATAQPAAPQPTLPLATPLPVVMPVAPPVVEVPQIDVPVVCGSQPAAAIAVAVGRHRLDYLPACDPPRQSPANRAGHSAGLSLGQHDPGTRRADLLDRARRPRSAQAAPPEPAVSAEAGHLAPPTPPQSKSARAAMPAAGQSGSQAESSQITPVADLNVAATPAESPAAAAPPAASTKLRRRHPHSRGAACRGGDIGRLFARGWPGTRGPGGQKYPGGP